MRWFTPARGPEVVPPRRSFKTPPFSNFLWKLYILFCVQFKFGLKTFKTFHIYSKSKLKDGNQTNFLSPETARFWTLWRLWVRFEFVLDRSTSACSSSLPFWFDSFCCDVSNGCMDLSLSDGSKFLVALKRVVICCCWELRFGLGSFLIDFC